jgi:hypothetical protein
MNRFAPIAIVLAWTSLAVAGMSTTPSTGVTPSGDTWSNPHPYIDLAPPLVTTLPAFLPVAATPDITEDEQFSQSSEVSYRPTTLAPPSLKYSLLENIGQPGWYPAYHSEPYDPDMSGFPSGLGIAPPPTVFEISPPDVGRQNRQMWFSTLAMFGAYQLVRVGKRINFAVIADWRNASAEAYLTWSEDGSVADQDLAPAIPLSYIDTLQRPHEASPRPSDLPVAAVFSFQAVRPHLAGPRAPPQLA